MRGIRGETALWRVYASPEKAVKHSLSDSANSSLSTKLTRNASLQHSQLAAAARLASCDG